MKKSIIKARSTSKKQKDTKYKPIFPKKENKNKTIYKTKYKITALEIVPSMDKERGKKSKFALKTKKHKNKMDVKNKLYL